jgi:hypothetical protein
MFVKQIKSSQEFCYATWWNYWHCQSFRFTCICEIHTWNSSWIENFLQTFAYSYYRIHSQFNWPVHSWQIPQLETICWHLLRLHVIYSWKNIVLMHMLKPLHLRTLVAKIPFSSSCFVKDPKCTETGIRQGCENHKFYKINIFQCTLWWNRLQLSNANAACRGSMVIMRHSFGLCIHTAQKFCYSLSTTHSSFHHVSVAVWLQRLMYLTYFDKDKLTKFVIPRYAYHNYLSIWKNAVLTQNSFGGCMLKKYHRFFRQWIIFLMNLRVR